MRLGVLGEWENPYLTMAYDYEATIVRELARFALAGLRLPGQEAGLLVLHLRDGPGRGRGRIRRPRLALHLRQVSDDLDDLRQQLPEAQGKEGLCRHLDHDPLDDPRKPRRGAFSRLHLRRRRGEERRGLYPGRGSGRPGAATPSAWATTKSSRHFREERSRARSASHPIYDRPSVLILADYVTLDAGTGAVHTAPGHGQEDYESGLKYGLDIYAPVDDHGKFTADVEYLRRANSSSIPTTRSSPGSRIWGCCSFKTDYSHQYPSCWRCKNPIVFRSTPQWFISMETQRPQKEGDGRDRPGPLDPQVGPRADLRDDRKPPRLVHLAASARGACPSRFSTARTAARRSSTKRAWRGWPGSSRKKGPTPGSTGT